MQGIITAPQQAPSSLLQLIRQVKHWITFFTEDSGEQL